LLIYFGRFADGKIQDKYKNNTVLLTYLISIFLQYL